MKEEYIIKKMDDIFKNLQMSKLPDRFQKKYNPEKWLSYYEKNLAELNHYFKELKIKLASKSNKTKGD